MYTGEGYLQSYCEKGVLRMRAESLKWQKKSFLFACPNKRLLMMSFDTNIHLVDSSQNVGAKVGCCDVNH